MKLRRYGAPAPGYTSGRMSEPSSQIIPLMGIDIDFYINES